MRSLFVRVFLTFWLASALMIVSLAVITAFTNARPLSHRWLVHSLDLYARTAVDAYEQGGEERLNEYLTEIRNDSQISATLLKNDANLTANPIPHAALDLLAQAQSEQGSKFSFRPSWLGVVRQVHGQDIYLFVAQVRPLKVFGNFIDPEKLLFRLAVVMLISTTLCGLLARSITKPIRSLQRTAMDVAGGDLSARASPALAGRRDELALLAHDFDRMADRVQLLLDQQQLLLRDISHELRSPLARLAVSAELVQRGDLAAAARMQSDIKALEKMISDLLTLARIDASDKLTRRESVHIGRLVQQIVKDASFEGVTANKTVVQTGVFERYVSADPGLLHSCVENIVRNAVKHTPDGGIVEVNIADMYGSGSEALAITTTDEGSGVPEHALEQIFDPFFRIPSENSHRDGGVGLGLSISKRIVTLYGGSITAQNLTDHGLQVQIRLPANAVIRHQNPKSDASASIP
ncbi:MAG TPA: ATP-binding protein [Edaphobacter sp.]|nr:ATP-binding protein [Edaphobacter sp.]